MKVSTIPKFNALGDLDAIWHPPDGEIFDTMFATSYTLSELIVCSLAMRFFSHEIQAVDIFNRVDSGVLKALFNSLDSRFLVAYDRIGLSCPENSRKSRISYFAKCLAEVPPFRSPGNQLCRFHPKLMWMVFKDANSGGITGARILVSSQNLTENAGFLEASLNLEFRKPKVFRRSSKQKESFLKKLRVICQAWTRSPIVDRLFDLTLKLDCVNWPDGVSDIALSNPFRRKNALQDLLNLKDGKLFEEALFFSPFLSSRTIEDASKICKRFGIISRQEEIDTQVSKASVKRLSKKKAYPILCGTLADISPGIGLPLHAKAIFGNVGASGKLMVGSSNLSAGGWGRNHELNVCLTFSTRLPDIKKALSKLHNVGDSDLYHDEHRTRRPSEIIRTCILEWMAEWSVKWIRSARARADSHYSNLPLSIVMKPLPRPVAGCEEEWKAAVFDQKVTVQCGDYTTREESPSISDKSVLQLKLKDLMPSHALKPSIVIRFGSYALPVVPLYDQFPQKKSWEEFTARDLIDALFLLQRPADYMRRQNILQQSGSDAGSVTAYSLDLERLIISFFCEPVDGMTRVKYQEIANRIDHWMKSTGMLNTTSDSVLIIRILNEMKKEFLLRAKG